MVCRASGAGTRHARGADARRHSTAAPGDRSHADSRHQGRRRLVACVGAAGSQAELDRSQPSFDRLDEVVAIGVPGDGAALGDLGSERCDHVVGVDRRGQADPRPVVSTIEICCNHEQLVGQRVVVGQPTRRTGTELELPRTPLSGEAIGIPEEQHGSGPVGVDGVEVGIDPCPARRGQQRVHGVDEQSAVGCIVTITPRQHGNPKNARSVGRSSGRPRKMSRSSTSVATTQASDERSTATMRASRGWTGSPSIVRPSGVIEPSSASMA